MLDLLVLIPPRTSLTPINCPLNALYRPFLDFSPQDLKLLKPQFARAIFLRGEAVKDIRGEGGEDVPGTRKQSSSLRWGPRPKGPVGICGDSQKSWRLLSPQSLIPIQKEGMAGQRGGHLGARLRGRGLGQDSTGQDGPLDGKIHPRG